MNIFLYLELALSLGTTAEAIYSIVKTASPANPITGAQIQVAVQPSIAALEAVFPRANFPAPLVTDICNAAADAIDKYVLHTAAPKA